MKLRVVNLGKARIVRREILMLESRRKVDAGQVGEVGILSGPDWLKAVVEADYSVHRQGGDKVMLRR